MSQYLIKNAIIVNENEQYQADMLIKDGRIAKIDKSISSRASVMVIDASGLHLIPGMIDDQVHFREPGLTHKGDIESESKAAVAGGITSYMEMPNCTPATTTVERLHAKKALAASKSHANFAFYLGATNDNVDELSRLGVSDACGIKIFMGASTGNMLVNDEKILERFFKSSPILIATHCEDTPMIAALETEYRTRYGESVPMEYHPLIRSREACYRSSSLAVSLAKKYETRLNVLHITTEEELALFRADIPLEKKRITAEVCAHHLYFSRGDYQRKGSLIKCNPAIKEERDRLALLKAVKDNRIDIIATDHAPHTWAEKQKSYFQAPSGLPLVQHALPCLFEHYHRGVLTLEEIIRKTAHAPAIAYGVKNRGFIKEGYYADLVLIDLNARFSVTDETTKYKCGWTPFAGDEFHAKIEKVFVNGILKFDDNKIISDALGQSLTFAQEF
ncbi:MAG: dihydroorotase [Francisellaceae bacterium]